MEGDRPIPSTLLETVSALPDPPFASCKSPKPHLRKRWRMLAILSADICASYLPWYTFVPIMSQSMLVYDALPPDFNMLCILYSLVYVPGVFFTGQLLIGLGCHRCFILALSCLTAGCALRCGPSMFVSYPSAGLWEDSHSLAAPSAAAAPFAWLVAGQGLCAVGQAFLVNATSHLVAEWFPPDERPAAAMISNLMNFVGGCLSFMVPTWYVAPDSPRETARAEVAALLLAQLKVSFAALVLTAALYRDAPSMRNMSVERASLPLLGELRQVLRLRDFWLINGHFLLYLTVLNTFDAVEGALLANYGYSEALSSWTAVSFCVTSVLSTAIESVIIKHPVHYRCVLLGVNGLLAASCLLGLWCLWARQPGACFIGAVGLMGFSTPGWGCSLEMGSEVSYPAREATVSALLEAFGSVASVGGIVAAQRLIDAGWAAMVLVAMAVGSLSGAVALLGLTGRMRRHEAEMAEAVYEEEPGIAVQACLSSEAGAPRSRRARHFHGELQCI
mmetsp:Transcript_52811/g.169084  ORF Transcript_52811/g.169084 Transcript_52811/m.169084 type:complete len:504 (+) Transcript_52811:77-1588(+)